MKPPAIHWIIKTEMGYILEDYQGTIVKWFDMAANCKAYCMDLDGEQIYLCKKSKNPIQEVHYRWATHKTLWWLRKER